MNSESAAELPFRIMLLDQLLGRFNHVAGQRNPVEMRDHEPSTWFQHAPRLQGSARTIEPMPALPSRYEIEVRRGQSSLFRCCIHVFQDDACASIQLGRLLHQWRRSIESGSVASAKRETARDRPGPRSEVERAHSGFQDSRCCQPLEKFVGKPCAMTSIVARGLAEIGAQFLEPYFC